MKLLTGERSTTRNYTPWLICLLVLAVAATVMLTPASHAPSSHTLLKVAVFAFAGIACGFLNTLASSGSAVSLPLMLMMGLNPHVANATNRFPVLIGSATAVFNFNKGGYVEWKLGAKLIPPMILGAMLGALVAELIPAKDLGPVIAGAVLMAFVLLFTKVKNILDTSVPSEPRVDTTVLAAIFGIGFWSGFIVLDAATYMLLALVLLVHMDLLKANAMKSLLLVAATTIAMAIFVVKGDIDWGAGVIMGAGSVIGGYAGVRVAVIPSAKEWTVRVLTAVILLELIHVDTFIRTLDASLAQVCAPALSGTAG